jgi:hypothetical protein
MSTREMLNMNVRNALLCIGNVHRGSLTITKSIHVMLF